MFYDLCLPSNDTDGQAQRARLAAAVKLGWDAVAAVHAVSNPLRDQHRYMLIRGIGNAQKHSSTAMLSAKAA